ncbi:hypothetical protein [Cognatishimia sp. MH4019]|uniref:hypothetical protein n=1 Tax=Cognatishimia sp. MH4019 TaxID=2854030 RepID=UPI001CD7787C|nr:hypothetical protein [Cognatishimia sp. MH4019]
MAETTKKPDPKLQKHDYVLQTNSWIGPHLKEKGDVVQMTDDEARYYVPHVLQKKSDVSPLQKSAPAKTSKPKD